MRKQHLLLPLLLAAALVLAACKGKPVAQSVPPSAEPTPTATATSSATPAVSEAPAFAVDPNASVALIQGALSGSEFDTRLWEGIRSFCQQSGKECWSYEGYDVFSSDSTAPRKALEAPVGDGRKVVVASGVEYLDAANQLSEAHPDTAFLVLDRYHSTLDGAAPAGHVAVAGFDQVQIGYLAGYAAVGDSYTRLGFLGFSDAGYGYGFVQGANDAAQAAGVTVELLYCYTDPSMTQEELRAMADLWYRSGIQLIFNARTTDRGVIAAAEENGRKVITVTGPLSSQSAAVLATASAAPEQAVARLLSAYYGGRFPGGEAQILGCAEQAIDLDISRMAKFGQYDYEHVYGKLAAGTVIPLTASDVESPDQLPAENVTVSFIEG